jgi:multicomponent Na+:H+ antiporter subunit D
MRSTNRLYALGVGVGLHLGDKTLLDLSEWQWGRAYSISTTTRWRLLFLTAGAIFYVSGREPEQMGGLGHNMKYTMIFFVIGALAIAGIPPLNGFASKLMIYESVFLFNPFLSVIAMVVSILTLASFVKVFHSIFMGPKLPEYAHVKEAPPMMLIGMGLLAAGVILFGLFPQQVVDLIVSPAAHALVNQQAYITSVMGGA